MIANRLSRRYTLWRWRISDSICFQQSWVLLSAVQPSAFKPFTGAEFHVSCHRHPPDSGSVTPPEIHQFSNLSPRQQKASEKTLKNRAQNHQKRLLWTSSRNPDFKSPKRPNLESKLGTKSDLGSNPKRHWIFKPRSPNNFQNKNPKSTQNQWKSCSGPHRVLPSSPMVLQGAPKVPKWFPRDLKRRQSEAPSHQNGNHEELKGPGGRGHSLFD